jgi:homospermidine synthase
LFKKSKINYPSVNRSAIFTVQRVCMICKKYSCLLVETVVELWVSAAEG